VTVATNERAEPVLLSGGNPQIPKGDGDGPVQDDLAVDEEQLRSWIDQASRLPGEVL